jgi:hypothetical protein
VTIADIIVIGGFAANAAIELCTSGFSQRGLAEGPKDRNEKPRRSGALRLDISATLLARADEVIE